MAFVLIRRISMESANGNALVSVSVMLAKAKEASLAPDQLRAGFN